LGAASLIAVGDAPALENEAEHHNEEGRRDRIVQAIILCDGVDDFHGTPDLKTGNPVAANSGLGVFFRKTIARRDCCRGRGGPAER
jgi:hypothetical protein